MMIHDPVVLSLSGEVIHTMLRMEGVTLADVAAGAGVSPSRVTQVLKSGGRCEALEYEIARVLGLDVQRIRRALRPKRIQAPTTGAARPDAAQVGSPDRNG